MPGATRREPQVEVEASVPREVREWIDRVSLATYKSRRQWIRDLLVSAYLRENTDAS